MSVEYLTLVLNHSQATGTAKLVLLGIANHAGDGGAWPSLRTLARYANVDQRNVRMALRRLEELGELRVHVQAGGMSYTPDYRRTNRYDVLVSCPPWCDRTAQHRDARSVDSGFWEGDTPPDGPIPPPRMPVSPAPRTQASPGPRTQASPGPRTQASPEPSDEPPLEPLFEPSGSAIHSSHGEFARDELRPVGFTPPLFETGMNE